MSKFIGFLVLVVGIVGLIFAVVGAWVSWQSVASLVEGVDTLGIAFDQTVAYVSEGLDMVSGTDVGVTLEGRVNEINANVDQIQENLNNQLRTVRAGLLLLFIWFGLLQLLPIYAGVDLMKDGMLGSKVL
jgi:hypothetical protein